MVYVCGQMQNSVNQGFSFSEKIECFYYLLKELQKKDSELPLSPCPKSFLHGSCLDVQPYGSFSGAAKNAHSRAQLRHVEVFYKRGNCSYLDSTFLTKYAIYVC